ncbi:MAG: hypothetical protein K8S87_02365, partial [Planctomycetes bacterium]|nr:hypothetical protein [Planctomycetota bacterium]
MKVWLIQTGEILPIEDNVRKMRTAMLAEKLVERGHKVLWWTSAFEHARKKWRFNEDNKVKLDNGINIFALKGISYVKHISLRRFVSHRKIAHKFKKKVLGEERPDIIIASTPPYDLAYQAVKFGKDNNIPVIVDIRDEWPELFLQRIPSWIKWLGRIALFHEFRIFKKALRGASALTSMMPSFIEWGVKIAKREKNINDRVFFIGCKKNNSGSKLSENIQFMNKLDKHFIVSFTGTF